MQKQRTVVAALVTGLAVATPAALLTAQPAFATEEQGGGLVSNDVVANNSEVTVSGEDTLRKAIEESKGTKENPTVIKVEQSIALAKPITITGGKYITIVGADGDITLSAGDTFTADAIGTIGANKCTALLQVGSDSAESSELVLSNISLNGNNKTRGVFLFRGTALSTDRVRIYSCVAPNNSGTLEHIKGQGNSGGAISVMWGTGESCSISLANTEINGCVTTKYGGAICGQKSAKIKLHNVNMHDNSCEPGDGGSSIYEPESLVLSGMIQIGKDDKGKESGGKDLPGLYHCEGLTYVASELAEGSEIHVSLYKQGRGDNWNNIAKGIDDYRLSEDDLGCFVVDWITGEGAEAVNHINEYVEYLDTDTNSIDALEAKTVTFKANYESASPAEKIQKVASGKDTELEENTFKRSGYEFASWNTKEQGTGDHYSDGQGVTLSADTTLYAQWKAVSPTVEISADSTVLKPGENATLKAEVSNTPESAHYTYTWFKDDGPIEDANSSTLSVSYDSLAGSASYTCKVTLADSELTGESNAITLSRYVPTPVVPPSTTVTETVTNADGSTTTTVTDKSSGTVTVTRTYKDGVVVKTVKAKDVEPKVSVSVPSSVKSATVNVPVEADEGTVAVDAKTGRVVNRCVATDNGLDVKVDGSCELVVRDNARDFSDMSGHWAQKAVDFASARGLMNGIGDTGTFEPETMTSRAMVCAVLSNLEYGPEATKGLSFADTDANGWYAKAVAWAAETGIVHGYGDGKTFGPNDDVTREQMACMIYNYARAMGMDTSKRADLSGYADADDLTYGREAMEWCVASGIFHGYDGSAELGGLDGLTRGQCAAVLMNLVTLIVEG